MAYFCYNFTVEPIQPGSEILIAHLSTLGFESFDQNDNGFSAYIKSSEPPAFNPEDYSFEDFKYTFRIEKIENTNWNQEWEKNFDPVKVGQELLIRAPFHEAGHGYAQEIVIMPKMSFGTGHHQTTRLMCKAILATDLKGKRVLDMGCGTGILAILSSKLGASQVTGIDTDEWSVENSLENCMNNNCPQITIIKGDAATLDQLAPFDMIFANINKNVLIRDMPLYVRRMTKNASLFLSGFFTTDCDELRLKAESSGLVFLGSDHEAEWAMLSFGKLS
ncbi:MAG TPA: 50S ribosomal protein L11 methyltransferase [Bacteroidia bacterium]|nr:50S ribosomal protein L11 methyltransferase [Bacteroidia bacterium]